MRRGWIAMVLLYGCVAAPGDGERPDSGGCRGGPIIDTGSSIDECPTGLILTEVMSAPDSGADFEWLEIYNGSGEIMAIDGLEIVRAGSDTKVFGSGIELQPGAYAVLARGIEPAIPSDYIYEGLTLTDSEATLCLSCSGQEIDCIEYGNTSRGVAWSLDPVNLDPIDNDDMSAWCAASNELDNGDLGTPGQENSACPIVLACPDTADLAVTEVLPNVSGDEAGEFIEIVNTGDSAVPLNCIRAVDGTSIQELKDCEGELLPGEFLVMARDLVWHEDGDYLVCEVTMTMTNGGERWGVGLETSTGEEMEINVIDCEAQDCPYVEGVSAQVDPRAYGETDPLFWCNADDSWEGQLASPGLENALCDLPEDGDSDGFYTPDDCDDGDNSIYPGAPDSYGDGLDQDCDGVDGTALLLSELSEGDLLLTELMPDPAVVGDSEGEWVELYNTTGSPISLDGLTEPCEIADPVAIAPGEHLVLAKKSDSSVNGGIEGAWQCSISLTNSAGTKRVSGQGVTIDTLDYGTPKSGKSIQRSYSGAYSDVSCDSISSFGSGDLGTPGTVNGACE
ncbi:MAG: hypothetical protein ACI9VR_001543 [Cognaticolwellia sp.]|jgi:hypothetical protein